METLKHRSYVYNYRNIAIFYEWHKENAILTF